MLSLIKPEYQDFYRQLKSDEKKKCIDPDFELAESELVENDIQLELPKNKRKLQVRKNNKSEKVKKRKVTKKSKK